MVTILKGNYVDIYSLCRTLKVSGVSVQDAFVTLHNNDDVKWMNYTDKEITYALQAAGYEIPDNLSPFGKDTGIGPALIGYVVLGLISVAGLGYVFIKRRK